MSCQLFFSSTSLSRISDLAVKSYWLRSVDVCCSFTMIGRTKNFKKYIKTDRSRYKGKLIFSYKYRWNETKIRNSNRDYNNTYYYFLFLSSKKKIVKNFVDSPRVSDILIPDSHENKTGPFGTYRASCNFVIRMSNLRRPIQSNPLAVTVWSSQSCPPCCSGHGSVAGASIPYRRSHGFVITLYAYFFAWQRREYF